MSELIGWVGFVLVIVLLAFALGGLPSEEDYEDPGIYFGENHE